jgi:hypothetical protein
MKKLYAAFVSLLAVAAFAVLPAVAQAQPHWYSNGVRIAGSKKVTVTTKGALDWQLLGAELTCKVKDKGTIENSAPGGATGPAGIDSITEWVTTECVAVPAVCAAGETLEINPGKLPWATLLLAGPPIRDEIKGMEIRFECNKAGVKTVIDVFTGNLTPKFVNGAPVTTCKEATDSFLEFDEPGSGFLTDPGGNKVVPSGNDFVEGPAGDRCITAKNQ